MIAVIADEPGESEGRISVGGETAEFGLDVARQGSAGLADLHQERIEVLIEDAVQEVASEPRSTTSSG